MSRRASRSASSYSSRGSVGGRFGSAGFSPWPPEPNFWPMPSARYSSPMPAIRAPMEFNSLLDFDTMSTTSPMPFCTIGSSIRSPAAFRGTLLAAAITH
ncbi:MAG: hypothetical protein U1D00_29155 [Mycobacterium sp.]|nr:hypothetical protein [Mycobacterium sp.]